MLFLLYLQKSPISHLNYNISYHILNVCILIIHTLHLDNAQNIPQINRLEEVEVVGT